MTTDIGTIQPLAEWRKAQGVGLLQLYRLSGVAPATVRRIERGERRPNWSTVVALAGALKVTPAQIAEGGER
jgi:transcriptional regulator with XRE-family HTH domain